jgi:hypothetical protein
MAQLHEHHDHAPEAHFKSRFDPLIICGQWSSADGIANKNLKLSSHFSFTLGRFRSSSLRRLMANARLI